jgi:regulator of replication initiation timing
LKSPQSKVQTTQELSREYSDSPGVEQKNEVDKLVKQISELKEAYTRSVLSENLLRTENSTYQTKIATLEKQNTENKKIVDTLKQLFNK